MTEMNHLIQDTHTLAMINTTNLKGVISYSVCMTELMTTDKNGDRINDYQTIRKITHEYFEFPESKNINDAILEFFSNVGKHATDHSDGAMSHREALMKEIRKFDLESFGGIIHSYERIIGCHSEYNGDKA